MTNATQTTLRVHRVYINAPAQKVWDAITNPEWTQRFGYGLRDEYDLRPGGKYRGMANEGMAAMGVTGVVVDGEVIESDPPRKLVVTRRSGREKLHFLNPVPIRLIHDRWIDKYTERQVSVLADLKTTLEEAQ